MCMESKDCKLRERMDDVERRCSSLESNINSLRGEMRTGIGGLTKAVNDLGHDFGERMNSMDARLIEEKAKWGACFRKWITWVVVSGISIIGIACGCEQLPNLIQVFRSFR